MKMPRNVRLSAVGASCALFMFAIGDILLALHGLRQGNHWLFIMFIGAFAILLPSLLDPSRVLRPIRILKDLNQREEVRSIPDLISWLGIWLFCFGVVGLWFDR